MALFERQHGQHLHALRTAPLTGGTLPTCPFLAGWPRAPLAWVPCLLFEALDVLPPVLPRGALVENLLALDFLALHALDLGGVVQRPRAAAAGEDHQVLSLVEEDLLRI